MNGKIDRAISITVMAWVCIFLSSIGIAISAMQGTLGNSVFGGSLVAFGLLLVSSIALLKRKEWARLLFVLLMGFGAAWVLGSLVLQLPTVQGIFESEPGSTRSFMINVVALNAALTIGICALCGWGAKRLLSQGAAAEFSR